MVILGLVLGFLTGGVPAYSREVQQGALMLVMTFSLTEISLRDVRPRAEVRGFALAAFMTYGALGGLILLFAALTSDPSLRAGWVLMGAVPPAIAVVPVTAYVKGNVRGALISDASLYVLALVTLPFLTYAVLGEALPLGDLAVQTLLLIGVPLVVSQPLRRWTSIDRVRPAAVSLAFFVVTFAIAGSTRPVLLERLNLVANLGVEGALRTFGIGMAVLLAVRALGRPRDTVVAATTFASFKNLGLTVVLAFALLGPTATLPAVVSLVFEILWMSALPLVVGRRASV